MKNFTCNTNCSLRDFTDSVYPQGSLYWNMLLKNKDIRVNGVKVHKNIPLSCGDEVTYYTTPAQESRAVFTPVYEDENVLVADKESGVNSEALFSSLLEKGEYYFIHRLDRNTAGLIVFAKNKTAETELLAAFRNQKVNKVYEALCKGHFAKKADTLHAYLKKDEKHSLVFINDTPARGGVPVVTEYRVLTEYENASLVRIVLHTGKTHQIRAHMAHVSHPVLGDEKYGDHELNASLHCTRQCLIAKELSFTLCGKLSYLNAKTFFSQKNFCNIKI